LLSAQLLVVDSLMGPFRVDYQGRGELSERQQKVGMLMSRLNKIAAEFNVAVVITNQVMADPGGSIFAGADNKKVSCCACAAREAAAHAVAFAARSPSAGMCWRTRPPRASTSRRVRSGALQDVRACLLALTHPLRPCHLRRQGREPHLQGDVLAAHAGGGGHLQHLRRRHRPGEGLSWESIDARRMRVALSMLLPSAIEP
jgi:hypothetical protein